MKKTNKIFFIFLTLAALLVPAAFAYYPQLIYPRVGNTTTLLPNGDILVTGGHDNTGNLVLKDEIYRSSTGKFEETSNHMGIRRSSHTATLLPNGHVLIFGGINSAGNTVQNIEVFDPETRTFIIRTTSSNIGTYARAGHTAVLLYKGAHKNQVFACGGIKINGTAKENVSNCVFIASSYSGNSLTYSVTDSIEMQTQTPDGLAGRRDHTATLLSNGNVLISGGRATDFDDGDKDYYPRGNEVYSAEQNSFLPNVDSLSIARRGHSAVSLGDGRVAIIGGYNPDYKYSSSAGTPYDVNSADNWYNSGEDGWDVKDRQNPGYHGIIDTMEVFDKNGKAANIAGSGDSETVPYRLSKSAGALLPDGTIALHGGRGNIPMSAVSVPVVFNEDSFLVLTNKASDGNANTYSVDVSSSETKATFPLPASELSKPVSGKFFNADMFIPTDDKDGIGIINGGKTDGGIAVTFDQDIRGILDGKPVGKYINGEIGGDYSSGTIEYDSVSLADLDGKVTVYPREGSTEFIGTPSISFNYLRLASYTGTWQYWQTYCNSNTETECKGTADLSNMRVKIPVPSHFDGSSLNGTFSISDDFTITVSGKSGDEEWTLDLEVDTPTDSISFSNQIPECTKEDDGGKTCNLSLSLASSLPIEFQFTKNSTAPFYASYLRAADKEFSDFVSIVTFDPDKINLEDLSYSADVSTIVVRDMLFSNTLRFTPADSSWDTSSEFYDYVADGYDEPAPPAPTALADHSIIIAASGAPLVIGGRACNPGHCKRSDTDTATATYEINETGSVASASMVTNKNTLLPLQRVYPSGGDGGELNTPRSGHTSTALSNGNILVCGGTGIEDGTRKTLSSCEIFKLDTNKWEITGSMNIPRSGHTASLLANGKVMIVGGNDGADHATRTSEIYNPDTGKFDNDLTYLHSPRANHTATMLANGNIFVVGGSTSSYHEVFITTRAVWETRYSGQPQFKNHTATLLKDGKVAVIGGDYGGYTSSYFYIYNPQDSADTNPTRAKIYEYDSICGSQEYPIANHVTMLDKNGNLWIIGGTTSGQQSKKVLFLQYSSGNSQPFLHSCGGNGGMVAGELKYPVINHTANLDPAGIISVFGGQTPSGVSGYVMKINTELQTVSYVENSEAIEPRANHTSIIDAEGNFVIIGGQDASLNYVSKVNRHYFAYNPDSEMSSDEAEGSLRKPKITNDEDENVIAGTAINLLSTGTINNFHGITDAGGGYGVHQNAPRVVLLAVDNPSGFLIDVSSSAYSTGTVDGVAGSFQWDTMVSSITLKLPGQPGAVNPSIPWGYYYVAESINGQFSNFKRVQVGDDWTLNKVQGEVAPSASTITVDGNVYGTPYGYTVYTSSIVWQWPNLIPNVPETGDNINVNGYYVYSDTSTETGPSLATIPQSVDVSTFVQTGLPPNFPAKIKIVPYNIWTEGTEYTKSGQWYTQAVKPDSVLITTTSWGEVELSWTSENTDGTCYQVEYCRLAANVNLNTDCFSNDQNGNNSYRDGDINIATGTAFSQGNCYSYSTFTTTGLNPVTGYQFRIRAINGKTPTAWETHDEGSGYVTEPSDSVSTVTVSNMGTISAIPSTTSILWSWDNVDMTYPVIYHITDCGTDNVYDKSSTSDAVFSFTMDRFNNATMSPNTSYCISVEPEMELDGTTYKGSTATATVYTLAVPPSKLTMNTNGTVLGITIESGNPQGTEFELQLSTTSDFSEIIFSTVTTQSSLSVEVDDNLAANECYYGQVSAINHSGVGTSTVTASGKVCTNANAPYGLEVASNTTAGILLTWNENGNPDVYNENGIQIGTVYVVQKSTNHVTWPTEKTVFNSPVLFSDLLTGTQYFFSLWAENQSGNPTGKVEIVVTSVSGPEGTPKGSIIGTSDPYNSVTISGELADGRFIKLDVPAEAYSEATQLAISSADISGVYDCDYPSVQNIGVLIFTEDNNPKVPVDLTIGYNESERTEIEANQNEILLARYKDGMCLPLHTTVNTSEKRIEASVNSLTYSVTGSSGTAIMLIRMTPPSNLSKAKVYPNPFYPNRGDGNVKIEPVPHNTKLTLYTLSGAKVWEGNSGKSAIIEWKGVNKHGNPVASGVYIGVLDSPSGKKKIKIAVEK